MIKLPRAPFWGHLGSSENEFDFPVAHLLD
jgi:hypothetical protein